MSKFTDAQITAMQDERFTVKQAAQTVGCSENTVRKYRKLKVVNPIAESAAIVQEADQVLSITEHEGELEGFSVVRTGSGEQDDTLIDLGPEVPAESGDQTHPGAIEEVEAIEAETADICGFRTQGSRFMCGLNPDHVERNIAHCYGTPVPA